MGAPKKRDGREKLWLLPSLSHKSSIYAIGFHDGKMKVGRSRNLRERVMTSYWGASNGGIVWAHCFCSVADCDAARLERLAIEQLAGRFERLTGTREWFWCSDKSAALDSVRKALREQE